MAGDRGKGHPGGYEDQIRLWIQAKEAQKFGSRRSITHANSTKVSRIPPYGTRLTTGSPDERRGGGASGRKYMMSQL
jgi:hypothetical protein